MSTCASSSQLFLIQGGDVEVECDFSRFGLLAFMDRRGLTNLMWELYRLRGDAETEWKTLHLFVGFYLDAEGPDDESMELWMEKNEEGTVGAYAAGDRVVVAIEDEKTRTTSARRVSPRDVKSFALKLLRLAVQAEEFQDA